MESLSFQEAKSMLRLQLIVIHKPKTSINHFLASKF
jgi:hypothetical protein